MKIEKKMKIKSKSKNYFQVFNTNLLSEQKMTRLSKLRYENK